MYLRTLGCAQRWHAEAARGMFESSRGSPYGHSRMMKSSLVLVSLLALLLMRTATVRAAEFDDSIAPLLAKRCLGCHNPQEHKGGLDLTSSKAALAGGDSGVVIAAGKPEESALWERVQKDEMPPKHPLPPAEKELIRQWLVNGARWGTDPIDRFKFTSESRAGYDWWALQPVRRPEAPASATHLDWQDNPIDRFILARLAAKNLAPSAAADKRTLIRRLSFDLVGLPPAPDDIKKFLANDSPEAYVKLVDRLLASPHYGERWGRHWLDVVRYGESHGFERDKLRPNAWLFRDWVISAFNDDLPYDEFVRLQVAGDALDPHNPEAVIASGFLVCAAYDDVGQTQQSLPMRAVVRQDEMEDYVGTTGQTFLGLTVNCSRCHDHKFDPITQKDYYRMCASLAGVKPGDRESLSEIGKARLTRKQQGLQAQVQGLQKQIDGIDAPARKRLSQAQKKPQRPVAQPIAKWEFNGDLKDSLGNLDGTANGAARVEGGKLILDGQSYVATAPLGRDLSVKTLEVWLTLGNLTQQGGGAISVQKEDGSLFDAIVFGERDAGQWMSGSNGFTRTSSFQAPVETEADKQLVRIIIVYGADNSVTGYRNGLPYGKPYTTSALMTFAAGKSQVLFGLRHSPPGGNHYLTGAIERAALYDKALSAEEVADLSGVPTPVKLDDVLAELSPDARNQRERLVAEASRLETRLRLLAGGLTYTVAPKAAETTHVLLRGDTRTMGEIVLPGALSSLRDWKNFELPDTTDEALRRIKLAEWLSAPANPLTARVMVNRLWHYHFGGGIVETPNDFGFNGGRPSHPELIDWLAAELMQPETPVAGSVEAMAKPRPWSLKHLQRLIVTSSAYRQASVSRPECVQADAGNRLIWRRSPQRLEAEAVRDAMLLATGELNPTVGGPGFRDFRMYSFNSQFYEPLDPIGYEFNRRTVYRTWVRSGRSELLDVFDCPDPSTTAPKRAVTTTPLQALSLLNNSFVLRMSQKLADRAVREAPQGLPQQVTRIYELAFARPPAADEAGLASQFVAQYGLPAYCRVILNSSEFMYVD